MKILRVLAIVAALIGVFALVVSSLEKPGEDTHIFSGLSGPDEKSTVQPYEPARWQNYESGSDSRLAILLTTRTSNWLGLAHGLKAAGIPFLITTDYARAFRHKVVIIYPQLTGASLSDEGVQALKNFTHDGGTLIGFNMLASGLQDVFGFTNTLTLKARYRLKFPHPPPDSDALEKEIPIDNQKSNEPMGAYAYTTPAETPIAVYEDGKAAITDHRYGAGHAVAFGFDLGALLLKGYDNRQENMARSYDNGYEPALDVLLRLIADIYRQGDDRAVTVQPVPQGKKLAVILTHDIDYTRSLANAIDYAQFEHANGIHATYFMQTKYIRDYNDDVILTEDSPGYLKQLRELGMEIASHTVSHSRIFAHFPLGDGAERYPDYHPFVENKDVTDNGTILGELRVSRFLIEQLVPGVQVNSFRPGYLSDPYGLPQALAATHYRYSSSVTANDSLTHLPFQLTYSREYSGEAPIYEFPITIADGPPLLTDRLPEGVDLAKKIARHGGLCVILIHPDTVEPKLGFEKQFVAGVKDFSWFGSLEDFGHWWEIRDATSIDSHWQKDQLIVHVKVPQTVEGLTLIPPAGMHPVLGQPFVTATDGHSAVLGRLEDAADIAFIR